MSTKDLLWIALKVAGLYLLTEGVLSLPNALVEDELVSRLEAGVPLAVGGLMLAIPLPTTVTAEGTVQLGGMQRSDWFWLVCKTLGLWWTAHGLVQVPVAIDFYGNGVAGTGMAIGAVVHLLIGLILLFSNIVPRLVTGRERRQPGLLPSSHSSQAAHDPSEPEPDGERAEPRE